MGLELYAKIEEYLDFGQEVEKLHDKFLALVKGYNPSSVIDIGCGQGAFLEKLNVQKIPSLGIDLSQNQIEICLNKSLNAKCTQLKELNQKFDCAVAIFDVINYIAPDELNNFFIDVYNCLDNNGIFIFDINTKFAFEEIVEGSIVLDKNDKFITIDANFCNGILKTQIDLFSQNKENYYYRQTDVITQYYHSKDKLLKSLKIANFNLKKTIGFKLHTLDIDDKMIFIAQK